MRITTEGEWEPAQLSAAAAVAVHRPVLRQAAHAAVARVRPRRRGGHGRADVHAAGPVRRNRRDRDRPRHHEPGRRALGRGGLRSQRREPQPGALLVAGAVEVGLRARRRVQRPRARQRQRHRPDQAAGRAAVLRRRLAQPALSLHQPRAAARRRAGAGPGGRRSQRAVRARLQAGPLHLPVRRLHGTLGPHDRGHRRQPCRALARRARGRGAGAGLDRVLADAQRLPAVDRDARTSTRRAARAARSGATPCSPGCGAIREVRTVFVSQLAGLGVRAPRGAGQPRVRGPGLPPRLAAVAEDRAPGRRPARHAGHARRARATASSARSAETGARTRPARSRARARSGATRRRSRRCGGATRACTSSTSRASCAARSSATRSSAACSSRRTSRT